jgi:hypothetical protein
MLHDSWVATISSIVISLPTCKRRAGSMAALHKNAVTNMALKQQGREISWSTRFTMSSRPAASSNSMVFFLLRRALSNVR